jgi:hypothetical protein
VVGIRKTLERLDQEAQADITAMLQHAGMKHLETAALLARQEYFEKLAAQIGATTNPVDQRMIDEKRGFWAGAVWAVSRMPRMIANNHEAFIQEAMKEAEELGRTRRDG